MVPPYLVTHWIKFDIDMHAVPDAESLYRYFGSVVERTVLIDAKELILRIRIPTAHYS